MSCNPIEVLVSVMAVTGRVKGYYIAQYNIATLKYDLEDEKVADFVNNLDRINDLGEKSEGFVWRLKGDGFDANEGATSIKVYDDPRIIVNYTVWKSIAELKKFAYNSDHMKIFLKRKKWFKTMTNKTNFKHSLVLWWIKDTDPIPPPQEGKKRLELLNKNGPTPDAFTMAKPFFPSNYAQSKL